MKPKKEQESKYQGMYEIISTPKEKELDAYVKKTRQKFEGK